jgi:hypothetical protein
MKKMPLIQKQIIGQIGPFSEMEKDYLLSILVWAMIFRVMIEPFKRRKNFAKNIEFPDRNLSLGSLS